MRPLRHLLLASLLLAGSVSARADDAGISLFRVPVTLGEQEVLPLGSRITLGLDVSNPAYLLNRLELAGISAIAVDGNVVELSLDSATVLSGDPLPRHSASSFVVDFDEPAIAQLVPMLQESHGATFSVVDLLEFVDEFIQTKSYRRDFDIASQVARTREGDCTEHAVLAAALARAMGRPARVVIGILLVETADELLAFGHAWAEVYENDGWRLADATRPTHQVPDARTHYLPLLELDNEGPGYSLSVLNFAAVQPARIGGVRTDRSTGKAASAQQGRSPSHFD